MDLVRITENDLNTAGIDIDSLNDDILANIADIRSCLEQVNNAWKSPGSTKYVNRLIDNYLNDLNELSEGITSYSNFIKHVYPTYNEVETTYKGKIDSIGV